MVGFCATVVVVEVGVVKIVVGFADVDVELIADETVVDGLVVVKIVVGFFVVGFFVVVFGLAVVGIVNIVGDTFFVVVVNFVVCTVELEFVQFVQFQPAGHEVKH